LQKIKWEHVALTLYWVSVTVFLMQLAELIGKPPYMQDTAAQDKSDVIHDLRFSQWWL
jgi:hypothetical protein